MIKNGIKKRNPDDCVPSNDVGRSNIDFKGLFFILFFILLAIAIRLPDFIPSLKHKIMLMDARSMAEAGNESEAKKKITNILNNSKKK